MTKQQYLEFHAKFCQEMIEVTKRKNSDYTGASEDPFANFKIVEQFGCVTVAQGFFTRMSDKMARISSFIAKGELQNESVFDSLLDLANYSALFAGFLGDKPVIDFSFTRNPLEKDTTIKTNEEPKGN